MKLVRKLAALLLVLAAAAGAADEGDRQLEQSKANLARMHERIDEIGRSIERDQGQQSALQADVETSERRLALARARMAQLQAQLGEQDKRVTAIQARRAQAQADVDTQRAVLARELRAAYFVSRSGPAAAVLAADDPGRAGRLLAYYGYLGRARVAAITALQARMQEVDTLAARLREETRRTAALTQAQQATAEELREQRAERAAAVSNMRLKIAGESQELKSLRASEEQTQRLIQSLKQALADVPFKSGPQGPFPSLRGRLQWPLRGPLLARFGQTKAEGRLQWKGIWISAPEGAQARAVARGRVAFTGWLSRYGLILVLQHEDGYFSLYGHASSVTRSTGDWVDAGDVVAAAGTTGGYDEPGIYLEIRKGTEAVDPAAWLGRPN